MKKYLFSLLFLIISCNNEPEIVDVLITGGTIHDGSVIKVLLEILQLKMILFFMLAKTEFHCKDTIDASNKIISPGL